MKKLNVNEMNVISSVVSKKVNDLKYEKIKSKIEKDVDYKKLVKISKEKELLSKKLSEINKLNNDLVIKIRNKFNINNVFIDNNSEIKVMFNNVNYNNIYNDIILFGIDKELNVNDLINKLVEKYSE